MTSWFSKILVSCSIIGLASLAPLYPWATLQLNTIPMTLINPTMAFTMSLLVLLVSLSWNSKYSSCLEIFFSWLLFFYFSISRLVVSIWSMVVTKFFDPYFVALIKLFQTTLVFCWTHVFLGFEFWNDISTTSYWQWFVWGVLGIWNVIIGSIGILLLSIKGFIMVGIQGIPLFNIRGFVFLNVRLLKHPTTQHLITCIQWHLNIWTNKKACILRHWRTWILLCCSSW